MQVIFFCAYQAGLERTQGSHMAILMTVEATWMDSSLDQSVGGEGP